MLEKIKQNIEKEQYSNFMGIKIIELGIGYCKAEMKPRREFENIFSIIHGGAIFSLIDFAFGSASNSYGTVAVALDVNINYIRPASAGEKLTAEAREISRGRQIGTYFIDVKNGREKIVASAQAIAFLKNEKLSFL